MRAVAVCVMLVMLVGCSAGRVNSKWSVEPVCRHTAILCAVAAEDAGIKTRIAVGINRAPLTNRRAKHAQAQGFIDGRWQYLEFRNGRVNTCAALGFTPVEYYNLWGYMYQIQRATGATIIKALRPETAQRVL